MKDKTNIKTIVCDDSKVYLGFLKDIFSKNGIDIFPCYKLSSLEGFVKEVKPEMILIDFEMAEYHESVFKSYLDGLDIVKIWLSQNEGEENYITAKRFGAIDYIYKAASDEFIIEKTKWWQQYCNNQNNHSTLKSYCRELRPIISGMSKNLCAIGEQLNSENEAKIKISKISNIMDKLEKNLSALLSR
ncbi:MAG: response regulator [Bacteriovoracaceae bacterium]|mgnify:CR=1 FL=1|jgi:DNA-binding NtrC family response regulator|nr:response regulator [Bacteriovoracaceae bacterium]